MYRIKIDRSRCIGCLTCVTACVVSHESNDARNRVVIDSEGKCAPIFCRHCDEPECASSCMSGALSKNPETGMVEYDEKRCAGCFMCVMNCPFGVLKPDTSTRSRIIKCDFCKDSGGEPSCVKACPKKAIWIEEVQS